MVLLAVASPFAFLCLVSNCAGLFQIPAVVLLGWISFLHRVLPQVSVEWAGVALALLCLALLVGVFQFLGRTLTQPSAGSTWSWRTSALLAAAAVVVFWSGLAAVGITSSTQRFFASNVLGDSSIRINSARTQSQNNLKQMGLAAYVHVDQHQHFPLAGTFDRDGRALHGWETALLPYVEQENLYKQIRLDLPWQHPDNRAALATEVYIFRSPYLESARVSDGPALTHYAGNLHVLGGRPLKLSDIEDGTANTLLMGETAAEFTPWGKPFNVRDPGLGINRAPNGFGNPSSTVKGASFVFADGRVPFISENISPGVLKALATPAGGEKIDDWNR
jgi:hypothetical protein